MSIEKQARRSLWRVVFWRLIGEILTLPQALIRGVIQFLTSFGQWIHSVEMGIFYMELDAARRYKLLTGVDLGSASGDLGRYAALQVEAAEEMQRKFMEGEGE